MLAVAPRVICLDEPTAGVAQREAEAFGPLIVRVQEELDATLVVVEHDLPLILAISDRIYCLEAGQVIVEGEPEASAHEPARRVVVPRHRRTGDPAEQRHALTSVEARLALLLGSQLHLPPLASSTSVIGCPVAALAERRVELHRRNASSAAYLPLHSDAMSVDDELDRCRTCRPPPASSRS